MRPIEDILKISDANEIYRLLTSCKPSFPEDVQTIERQWDVMRHNVMDTNIRKKKRVKVDTGKIDHKTGKRLYKEKLVDRCRIAVPIQQVLVNRGVGFLFSNPVRYAMTGGEGEEATELYNTVMRTFKDNKIAYKDKQLARTIMREREAAELWYYELDAKGKPQRIRMKILKPSEGNKLFPHFDDWGNMDGFAREYCTMSEDASITRHFDVYTRSIKQSYVWEGSEPVLTEQPKLHGFSKVPVIYYRQQHAEWHKVQIAIERVEELLSNWADTNDYFGKPAYVAKGEVVGFAEKGETGSVYQIKNDGDLKVLSWDNSPTSINNELSMLMNAIFSYSQIPDISFETMKQLGNNTSGVAIQLMFTDPHMMAEDKIEMYGEMFQRRYNLVQNGIATSLLSVQQSIIEQIEVEPKFEPYMPKNVLETLQLLNLSTGNKATMSQQAAIKQNPLVDNAAETLKQLQEEAATDAQLSMESSIFGIANGDD